MVDNFVATNNMATNNAKSAKQQELEQKQYLQVLAEWTKQGENMECADCTAKRM